MLYLLFILPRNFTLTNTHRQKHLKTMALEYQDQIKILSILTMLICIKFFFVILASGGKRKRAPEDGFQPKTASQPKDNESDNAPPTFTEEERWKRIVQNDMENIPITLTLMWIAVITRGNFETNVVFAAIFLFGRVMHTICMSMFYLLLCR